MQLALRRGFAFWAFISYLSVTAARWTPPMIDPDKHPNWRCTEDGSWSWYDDSVGELQHNRAGAYTEALTQYVQPLLSRHPANKSDWRILDACFGLGYNTWTLTQALINKQKKPQTLVVWAIEIDPCSLIRSAAILSQPMFYDLKAALDASAHNIYYQTQQMRDEAKAEIQPNGWLAGLQSGFMAEGVQRVRWTCSGDWGAFNLYWVVGDLTCVYQNWVSKMESPVPVNLDGVFHDAFSWKKMPHLWTADMFTYYCHWLSPDGAVLTYSRASVVKAAMVQAGYSLVDTKALGGKRGGLLATPSHVLFSN